MTKDNPWQLVDEASGRVVVERLEVADGFWSRLSGLQFRRELPAGCGLLLVPCGSIHTCWMRFAIDMVCLDGAGRVLAVKPNIRPWRAAMAPRGTYAVLEMPAGEAANITAAQRLLLAGNGDTLSRKSLQFLGRE